MRTLIFLSALSLVLVACGDDGDDGAGGEGGLGELVTQDGSLSMDIALEESGASIGVGQNALLITLTDEAGLAITDATVTVDPQMPSMGHGSSEDPVVTHQGEGVYRAFPVTFTMAGDWEVTFVAETPDGRTGRETWRYDVPQGESGGMDMSDGGMDMGDGGMDMGDGGMDMSDGGMDMGDAEGSGMDMGDR